MTKRTRDLTRKVPRGPTRRMELAAIAEKVFLKHGYVETTMQMIASEAGSSKETLYRHFASKEALFAELIGARAAAIAGPRTEAHWADYVRALDYKLTKDDETLIEGLVPAGHPSTPGYNDPAYPIEGRVPRSGQ